MAVLKYLMKSRVSISNFVVRSCNLRFRIEANTMNPSEQLDCIGTLKYCIMQKLLQIVAFGRITNTFGFGKCVKY